MDTDVSEKHSASTFRAEEGLESAVLDEEYLVPSNFFVFIPPNLLNSLVIVFFQALGVEI